MNDRTVHARLSNGVELVRYDKAGKWYAEKKGTTRDPITLTAAVNATMHGDKVFYGRPGGKQFDARVRRRLND